MATRNHSHLRPAAVVLTAALALSAMVAGSRATTAEELPPSIPGMAPEPVTTLDAAWHGAAVHDEGMPYDQHGIVADRGPSPAAGQTFDAPSRSFSLFRSPVSYGMECWERCTTRSFRPRGTGVAERTSCHRMDYSPYVLEGSYSHHGPSYYPRIVLPPCCALYGDHDVYCGYCSPFHGLFH